MEVRKEVSRNGETLAQYRHNALGQRVSKYVPGAVAADAPGQGTDNSVNDGDKLRGLEQALSRAKATLEQALFQQETNPGKGNKTLTEDSQLLFVYNQSGQLQGEYNADGSAVREYIYLNGTPLALIEHSNNQIGYYHSDHLGTPQRVTGDHQQVLWQASYTPFGNAQVLVENITQPLRFPGQYFDSESGLHYNYFRDYDPTTGRYLQSDPIGILMDYSNPLFSVGKAKSIDIITSDTGNVDNEVITVASLGLNHNFTYALNNPINIVDSDGLNPRALMLALAAAKAAKKQIEGAANTCKNIRCKIANHDAHHTFEWWPGDEKKRRHIQLNCWQKGKKGSNFVLRFPY